MPYDDLRLVPARWQARAKEILARAKTFHNRDARRKLREIAVGYRKLARRLEQRARDVDGM
jgi:hypothetical protein